MKYDLISYHMHALFMIYRHYRSKLIFTLIHSANTIVILLYLSIILLFTHLNKPVTSQLIFPYVYHLQKNGELALKMVIQFYRLSYKTSPSQT